MMTITPQAVGVQRLELEIFAELDIERGSCLDPFAVQEDRRILLPGEDIFLRASEDAVGPVKCQTENAY